MSAWWNDVETQHGAKGATRNGMFAALGFAGILGITAVYLGVTGTLPRQNLDPLGRIIAMTFVGLEIAACLLAAWRFRMGKGWLAGGIVLLIFVIEIGFKLFSGFFGIAWYLLYFAIFMGLANGVRGAWALRDIGEEPADLSDTFA
ncbi:MAG: hypothetical protein JO276_03000 [Sphingomonadaceae bacterium]|nr:hypothetical protein [Sphingomonadaceae bacterium]